jgi:hypothetical protein
MVLVDVDDIDEANWQQSWIEIGLHFGKWNLEKNQHKTVVFQVGNQHPAGVRKGFRESF